MEYNGRAYYVCCSGCAAEFKHDPETWLRLAQEANTKKAGGKSAAGDAGPPAGKPKGPATE